MYGVEETADEVLDTKTLKILQEIGEKPVFKDFCRAGLKHGESFRPVNRSRGFREKPGNVNEGAMRRS
jgi:hypothetical protein